MTQIKDPDLFLPAGAARYAARQAGQAPAGRGRGRDAMRRLAWACALLMVVVVAASAWLRLAQPRPACAYWPTCRIAAGAQEAAVAPAGFPASPGAASAGVASPGVIGATRAVHRVAASIVLPTVLVLAVLALMPGQRRHRAAGLALALLGLAIGLALLGIVTPGSRAPPVLLGNMLGGLLMLGLAWRLVRRLGAAPAVGRSLACRSMLGAGLLMAQAALGVLSGAGIGADTGADTGAVPAVAHVALAFVAVSWMIGVGNAARRQGREAEGTALVALAVAQLILGTVAFLSAAQPVLVLAHNMVAALGLALLLGLGGRVVHRSRSSSSRVLAPRKAAASSKPATAQPRDCIQRPTLRPPSSR